MSRTFHLLTESEPFSEHLGGAISRWVANVLREDEQGIVLAPSADRSWGFSETQLRVLPTLASYKRWMQRGGHRLPWVLKTLALKLMLRDALHDIEPGDTVWVHNRPEFVLALQSYVHRRGANILLHLHNSHLVDWSRRVTGSIKPDGYVFLTKFLEAEARERFPHLGPTAVTYSGADTRIFHPSLTTSQTPSLPFVLFVGRLVPDKGVHVLIAAMGRLQQRSVPLRALIVGASGFGAGEASTYIKQLHQDAPSNVTFAPYCSGVELGDVFRQADILCVPSCWKEALGLVVLEGMASGLPIVATRSGGIPELLSGGGGLLVERNDPVELADALETLALDPALRRHLGAQALSSQSQNFTWAHVRTTYRQILGRATPQVCSSPGFTSAPLNCEDPTNV